MTSGHGMIAGPGMNSGVVVQHVLGDQIARALSTGDRFGE
jgi:hypothetical protein